VSINVWSGNHCDRKHAMKRKISNLKCQQAGQTKRLKLSYLVRILIYYLCLKRILLTRATSISQSILCITQCILTVKHSGIALIIRSSIKYYEINKHQRDFLQATSVIIEAWNGCIIISTVYSQSKHVIKSEQYITFLKTLGNRFIAAGN